MRSYQQTATLGIPAMTVLVLLAASTGAGVVASHLRGAAPDGDRGDIPPALDPTALGGTGKGTLGPMGLDCPVRCTLLPVLVLGLGDLHPDQGIGDEVLDALEHIVENLKALDLVLDQGVLLCIGAQAHRIAQVLQGHEVVLPPDVDLTQVVETEEVVERLFSSLSYFCIYLLVDAPLKVRLVLLARRLGWQGYDGEVELRLDLFDDLQRDILVLGLLGQGVHYLDGNLMAAGAHPFKEVLLAEDGITLGVYVVPLFVEHVVIVQQVLANLKVAVLNTPLCLLKGIGEHAVLDGHPVLHPDLAQDAPDVLRGEQAHQRVVQGDVEAAGARVPLAAAAPTQLVVDTARLVPLRTHDIEATEALDLFIVFSPRRGDLFQCFGKLFGCGIGAAYPAGTGIEAASELDVGSPSCHVGGDGDRPLGTGLFDDQGLTGVVLRVEHLVPYPHPLEQEAEHLTFLDRDGTDEDRLPLLVYAGDLLADGLYLELLVVVDLVRVVNPDDGHVGGDDHHIEVVDLQELRGLGIGCPGHAADLVVHPEEVLVRDGGQRLVLAHDLDLLLGLDGLVQAVAIASAMQDATGELIDYLHLALDDDIVDIVAVELQGPDRLGDVVHILKVLILIDGAGDDLVLVEQLLHVVHALVGEGDLLLLLIELVVPLLLKRLGAAVKAGEWVLFVVVPGSGVLLTLGEEGGYLLSSQHLDGVVLALAADDQGRARLVYQDGVDLVNDAVVVLGLDLLLKRPFHVVSQVVEPEFVVGAVCDVGIVGEALRLGVHVRQDYPDAQTQELVDGPHPLRVSTGEVVVDGDNVHPLLLQAVEVGRRYAGKGLSLTGLHLQDLTPVQDRSSHDLHIVMPLAKDPARSLACQGEGLGKQRIQGGSLGYLFSEEPCLEGKVLVLEAFCPRVLFVYILDDRLEGAQVLILFGSEQLGKY